MRQQPETTPVISIVYKLITIIIVGISAIQSALAQVTSQDHETVFRDNLGSQMVEERNAGHEDSLDAQVKELLLYTVRIAQIAISDGSTIIGSAILLPGAPLLLTASHNLHGSALAAYNADVSLKAMANGIRILGMGMI